MPHSAGYSNCNPGMGVLLQGYRPIYWNPYTGLEKNEQITQKLQKYSATLYFASRNKNKSKLLYFNGVARTFSRQVCFPPNKNKNGGCFKYVTSKII